MRTNQYVPPPEVKQDLHRGQRGIALVTAMLGSVVVLLLAFAVITTAIVENRVSGNYRNQTEAFYISEAGFETAKDWLKANMNDPDMMEALLTESAGSTINNPPDQSVVTVLGTDVDTPLGVRDFGNGSYNVWIRDNTDDGDFTTDVDTQWVVTSRGVGPRNSSKIIEGVLAAATLVPEGMLNMHGTDSHPDFDAGSSGTGNRIPPSAVDGNSFDLAGNPGGSCPAVPAFATDDAAATTELIDDLDDLRSNIVKRANDFCEADGSTQGGDPPCGPDDESCCTPGLWWIRGSDGTPRYDDSDPSSYSLLDLSAPELHAINADYVTITQPPTMILGSPATRAFGGAAGNTGDPLVNESPPIELVEQLAIVDEVISRTSPADIVLITNGRFDDGGTHTYGSATDPKVVTVTDEFRIENNTTFIGFGTLVVEDLMRIEADGFFEWTGIVIIRGSSPELRSRGGGQINGVLYFDSTDGTVRVDIDKATDELAITYSCDAIAMAMDVMPLRTISWIELHQ